MLSVWRLTMLATTACALAVENNNVHVDEAHLIDNLTEAERMTPSIDRATDEDSDGSQDNHIDEAHLIGNLTDAERKTASVDRATDEDSDGSQDNHIDEAHLIENSTIAERVMSPQGITEAPAERRDSGCHSMVEIFASCCGYQARERQPHIFRTYIQQPDTFNGRPWFKSDDGVTIIAYFRGQWLIQPTANKGSNIANAYTTNTHTCPNDAGSTWKYWSGYSWLNAYDGLKMAEGCGDIVEALYSCCGSQANTYQPHLFTTYRRQPGTFNGRAWFKTDDGVTIITFHPWGYWLVQPAAYKGTTTCNAYTIDTPACPNNVVIGNWNYWNGNSWVGAGPGLKIAKEYENIGQDCWYGCTFQQGHCNWCGTEGKCCRKDWTPGNGCDRSNGIEGMGHVCVP